MTSWFGNQWGKFLSSMPENIGVFAVIFFLLFIAVSALFSLTKRFMQNIAALAAAIVSAFVSFLLVDSIYGILLKREGIQAAINELLEKFPELGASSEGVVAVSKFVVSLVAVPALFLIVYGIFSLVTSIIFRKYQKEGVSGGKKAESNISSTVKIIIGVLSGVAAFVAYFFPSHSFVDLTVTAGIQKIRVWIFVSITLISKHTSPTTFSVTLTETICTRQRARYTIYKTKKMINILTSPTEKSS